MTRTRIGLIVGTRPEAIKMAPVFASLAAEPKFEVITICSGQHVDLLPSAMREFGWEPDITCELKSPHGDLLSLYVDLLNSLGGVLAKAELDYILVHGDTATTAIGSLASILHRIPLGHVEAGLRSRDKEQPWPEEINRRMVDVMADHFFAPSKLAVENLRMEGVSDDNILQTGNTGVDAVLMMSQRIQNNRELAFELENTFKFLNDQKRLVLVTGHRRENKGKNTTLLFRALEELMISKTVCVVLPVHPNIKNRAEIIEFQKKCPNLHIVDPLKYSEFVYLMKKSSLIITDSGGIQEEAPSFGKKVLVTRNVTERPEGIASGFIKIVGNDPDRLVCEARKHLLLDTVTVPGPNPYGDGNSAQRIAKYLKDHFNVD